MAGFIFIIIIIAVKAINNFLIMLLKEQFMCIIIMVNIAFLQKNYWVE